jgi:hypothetical protein
MPKVPGVTRDLLQKQILELLEGIGIPAKEWIGKGGSKVRRLVTKTDVSPFKPNLLGTLSQQKKTFGDALDIFQNEAKFIMNANDQELMNLKNNIIDYTNRGGYPKDPGSEGIGSMMKDLETSLKDLKTSAKDLKKGTEDMSAHSKKMWDDMIRTAQVGGDPFKVPDKKSFGGSMYAEGNMRTALREFLQTEFKNGRLNLNKNDQFRVMNYSPMSEDDPILVFKRIYGDDAIRNVEDIVNVFEKGESFKHYEQLLRENVDNQFLKPLNQADVGDGKLVLTEAEEIKPSLPDDEVPFNQGGRVGLKYGTKKLFNFTKKQLLDAVNDIFPTGDRKYDAELVSDALVENNPQMFKNRLRQDLDDSEYTEIYGIALDALDAFNAEAKALMKPKIDFSDPKIKAALENAGVKGIALSDAAKKMGYDMSKQKDFFAFEEAIAGGMEGFPKEIKEQIIRAKYGNVVDQRLLDNMLVDDDPYRLAEVFATVEQGLKMQEMGMGGDEIVTAIKADIKRKPNAAGGGVGSLFSPTDRVGLFKGSSEIAKSLGISAKEYAQRVHSSGGKKIKEILDDLMRHKKIRALVEKVNKDLHETGIAKMWREKRAVDDENKIVAEKVIAPFVETVDKLVPWKLSDKSQRNATLAWFRESITNPEWRKDYRPDWEKGKTVFRGMKHPDDLIYSKDHPSNMFAKQQYAEMFKPENVGGFASTEPSYAIKYAKDAKGVPHVTKTHLDPIEFQEAVERNILENPYGSTGDVILNEEQKKALKTDIVSSGIALIKKYLSFNKGGLVNKQKVYKHGVGSMFKEV